ncbi:MAG: pyruvate kinase [Chloroflexota bacterium]
MRKTKIVATLGPAPDAPGRIGALIAAGMDVARVNMSHGFQAENAARIAAVRAEAARQGRAVAVLLDLQGPKIRTGPLLDDQAVELVPGQTFRITTRSVPGGAEQVGTSHARLPQEVWPGDRILISDGLIELRVEGTTEEEVIAQVVAGGWLRPRQGINLPGVAVNAPSLTDKDVDDLRFGMAQDADYIALSFVRRAEDVARAKELIAQAGGDAPVIAKLEKPEALDALDAILQVADGVMVARGDLGVELALEKVPVAQKAIIRAARRAALPVITATQMLESMIHHAQPTRAEVSDVANAILDGSDAIMLSGETAIGAYPVQAVEMMARIAETVEAAPALDWPSPLSGWDVAADGIPEAVGAAVDAMVRALPVRAVCVLTKTGSSARLVARYRPAVPILAMTPAERTYRRLSLLRGVTPLMMRYAPEEAEYYRQVQRLVLEYGYAAPGERVVVTGGHPIAQGGPTNFIKVLVLEG